MRLFGIRMIAPVLAFALAACGVAQAQTPVRPTAARLSPSPSPSPTPSPTPHVVIDAAYLAGELGSVEDSIRMADTPGDQ